MKSTNITISLDTRRELKDGTYPLIMRLGHNERTTSIPLSISLPANDWDNENKIVKKSYKGVSSVSYINNLIQKKKSDAMDVIFKLHEANVLDKFSVTSLRDKIVGAGKSLSFIHFANQTIDELQQANRIGTAKSYRGVVNVLTTFCGGKDLQFKDINYSFLNRFETNHKKNGNQLNGLAVYMRTIRAIFNKAIKEGVTDQALYPFNDYKIRTVPTEKRALDWDALKKIISLQLEPNDNGFRARNYFVASYMLYGMNFADMAFLEKSDIKDGRIVYRRKKTSKLYNIKITDSLNVILQYYMNQTQDSKYIFPIIKRETAALQDKDIQWARKRYNKQLKHLAKICGIEQNLTTYVSRHSFATQAMLQEVPLNAISIMLGHSSLKTTEIYLKTLPSNILDDYNAKILDKV